jgi:hypothetical protein
MNINIKTLIINLLLINSTFIFGDFKSIQGFSSKQPITPSFYAGVIHLSDLDIAAATGGAMYTINTPGRYYVANNLSMAPDNPQVSAIKITASGVLLDLNETTIFQRAGNFKTGLMGVEVDSSVANVRIINGNIRGLNIADSTEQNAGIVVQSGANNIFIENVIVSGCTSATAEVSGFLLSSCNNVKLINCESSNNTNTLGTASAPNGSVNGFKLDTCSACTMQNCTASRNSSDKENSYGFKLVSSSYNKLLNCIALNQISTANTGAYLVAGFYSKIGVGNLFEYCTSNGSTNGTVSATLISAGFFLDGATKYSTIRNCLSQSNNGGSGLGYGISIASAVTDCSIDSNFVFSNTGTAGGIGIIDAGTTSVAYFDNLAHGNRIPASTVDNYSGSIGEILTATHTVFTNLDNAKVGFNNLEVNA